MAAKQKYRLPDLGDRHGRLTVFKPCFKKNSQWEIPCLCDCGTLTVVRLQKWVTGWTRSCGCLKNDTTAQRNETHGESRTQLYSVWANMRQRCGNPKRPDYSNYGGRGIKVCAEWQQFEPFRDWAHINGYKKGLTLDRINNDKGYSPKNCRWITHRENSRNRRNSRSIIAFGETKTVWDWTLDPRCKTSYKNLLLRINKLGWKPEPAITTPTTSSNRYRSIQLTLPVKTSP